MFFELPEKEMLPLDQTTEEMITNIQVTEKYVNDTTKWMEQHGEEIVLGYFTPPKKENTQEYDGKKEVVKLLIAGIQTNNVDIFLSSFDVKTISNDLSKYDVTERFNAAEEIMNRISRNGQLKEVYYEDIKGFFDTQTKELNVTFVYADNSKAKITLETVVYGDNHENTRSPAMYAISTSVWEIINKIETAH